MHTINKQHISCNSHVFFLTRVYTVQKVNNGQTKAMHPLRLSKLSSLHYFSIIAFKVQEQSVRQRRRAGNLSKLCVSCHWNVWFSLKKRQRLK